MVVAGVEWGSCLAKEITKTCANLILTPTGHLVSNPLSPTIRTLFTKAEIVLLSNYQTFFLKLGEIKIHDMNIKNMQ